MKGAVVERLRDGRRFAVVDQVNEEGRPLSWVLTDEDGDSRLVIPDSDLNDGERWQMIG